MLVDDDDGIEEKTVRQRLGPWRCRDDGDMYSTIQRHTRSHGDDRLLRKRDVGTGDLRPVRIPTPIIITDILFRRCCERIRGSSIDGYAGGWG